MPTSVSRDPSTGDGTSYTPVVESSFPMSGFFPTIMSVKFIHVAARTSSFPFTTEPCSPLQIHQFLSSTGISDLGPL